MTDEDRHGPWSKDEQRYEDDCKEDRSHIDEHVEIANRLQERLGVGVMPSTVADVLAAHDARVRTEQIQKDVQIVLDVASHNETGSAVKARAALLIREQEVDRG